MLSPARAGSVSHPEEWKWSSYVAIMAMIKKPKSFYPDWIIAQFGHDIVTARKAYRDFVITGIKKEFPWNDLKGGTFLGKENFIEEVKEFSKGKERIKEIPRTERFVGRPPLKEISGEKKQSLWKSKGCMQPMYNMDIH